MWRPSVLTPSGLEHIANHKYKAGKYTPLDNLLNPWWLRMSEALPIWFAPNLVTLLGFAPLLVTYVLVWFSSPDCSTPPSRALAAVTSVALWFYQTMDALDGKQARRTGSSSPLGQLFDHGCDCLATVSQHSAVYSVLCTGSSPWTFAGLSAVQTGFFMAQWQEYYTGVLRTSFGPVGVTETQYVVMAIALTGFLAGPEVVQAFSQGPSAFQLPWLSAPNEPFGVVFSQGWVVFVVFMVVICFVKTIGHIIEEKGVKGVAPAMKDLLPITVMNVLIPLWNPAMQLRAPRLLILLNGLIFFYLTAQMILFSMARMPFPAVQLLILPYAALVRRSWTLEPDVMYTLLLVYTLAIACWILLWLSAVIEELKARLGIYAFSLAKPSLRQEKKKKSN
ncbi:unnamed protein product [Polarella glacialis]|uniref:Ethanolaminephosphotransferase n=1 Tax=Polarella glacialis TaxID=89957 RepID=A0A813KLH1_POLGL|nr:unnamed protein product [Polarella glacialis]